MKIRTGFVSNSSSASFTLVWRIKDEEEQSVEEAVGQLMEYSGFEDDIKDATTKGDSPNAFVSRFWTCMLNTEADIGADALALYFTLAMKQKRGNLYEILSAELIED